MFSSIGGGIVVFVGAFVTSRTSALAVRMEETETGEELAPCIALDFGHRSCTWIWGRWVAVWVFALFPAAFESRGSCGRNAARFADHGVYVDL